MTPTPRAALALGGAALLTLVAGVALGAAAAVVVVIATIVDLWLSRMRPQVTRSHPKILPRGYAVDVAISASSGRATRIDVRQPLPADLEATPATGRGRIDGKLIASRRGHHTIPGVATRVHGPLGLGATVRIDDATSDVVVYPDVVTARRLALAVAKGHFSTEGLRRGNLIGIGTEFESIRDYSPDDDIRQVNWRATARLGRPMSNQYRIDQDRDVVLVIDTGRLMAAPLGNQTRLDAAVDAATAIAYTADVLGDRVGVVAFDRAVRRHLAPRRLGGEAAVGAIFDLEPTEGDANYDLAFRVVERMKRALVIVFTDLLEASAARPLVGAMPVMARRHSVVVAGSSDPDLIAAIAVEPLSSTDVYRSAVAVDALTAREAVAHELGRTGATVVEAPPRRLAAAAIAAYLDAKARARI